MRKITICLFSAALLFAGSLVCRAVPITDLSEISDLGGSYELTADAVLPDDFTPIGSSDAPFTGKFDGDGHTVSISGKAGLFSAAENAEIRNVSVCGFSAGGHLAMLVCEKANTFVSPVSDSFSAYNAHPNACILGYPVVTLGDGTYPTMPEIFLGDKKDDETEIAKYSYMYNLDDMPPTFAFYGENDRAVNFFKNAEAITAALKAAGKTAECHAFSDAGHGVGLGEGYADYSRWLDLSVSFLQNAFNA